GNALLEIGEGLLGVLVLRDVDPGEARHRALGAIAGDLHLAREGKHVGDEAHARQGGRLDLLRLAVRLRLVQDRGEVLQRVGEARRARLVHRDVHVGSGLGVNLGWKRTLRLRPRSFAAYRARSACEIHTVWPMSRALLSAMPMLAVTRKPEGASAEPSMRLRMRSAMTSAPASGVSGSSTPNSSPP